MVKKDDMHVNGGKLTKDPPDYLGQQAKVVWRKVVPFLEQETNAVRVDGRLVELYATQYEIYRNAYKHIQEHGEVQAIYKTVQNSLGEIIDHAFTGYKRNPMTQVYDNAVKNLARIGSELGLSPKSRAELMEIIPEPKKDKPIDEQMKEFLNSED